MQVNLTVLKNVGLEHFLVVSAILFSLGIYAVVTRKNAIMVLMGIELILNSANINFIAFSKYSVGDLIGHLVAIFVIILAAAEAAIAIAIILNIYKNFLTVNIDEVDNLKR
jgi:NADH-quinone oxidoreductase subunit K